MQDIKGGELDWILRRSFRIYFFIIIFLLVAIFFLFLILMKGKSTDVTAVPTCGDGSLYNTCSLDKPYYCSNGTLIQNDSCGCPAGMTLSDNGCYSKYETYEKNATFNYTLDGKQGEINLTLYGGMSSYLYTLPESIFYSSGQVPQLSDFALRKINNQAQYDLLEPLVKKIENLAPESKVDQARIAISLVQNIPWGSSGREISFMGNQLNYSRYPYQVLYDNQGLCGEKSELLAFVLRDLGYNVALFYYPQEDHEAVGIKCPVQDSLNGTGYCFVETSGPAIISDSNLVYVGGITLDTQPQLIVLSGGISLPANLPEYKDAKTLYSLGNRMFLGPIAKHTLESLQKKYGLPETYNIS